MGEKIERSLKVDQKEVEKLLHGRSLKTYLALFHFEEADSVAE